MIPLLYISKSKIREGLLVLFFTNPHEKYYLRELERLLGFSAGSIRRELLKLVDDDLFETEKRGNLLYYSLNKNHPLFDELKSIVSKTAGVEHALRSELSKIKNIKAALIFGSFASKKDSIGSDIDIMIIGSPDITKLNRKISFLENKLKREINPVIYSLKEYKLKKKENRQFIIDILKKPKILLIGKESDL